MSPSHPEVRPTEVRRLPDQCRLRITWTDGHVGEYDYDYLRGYCPCAACQGHTGDAIRFHPPPGGAEGLQPEEIQPVGNYALSIGWSDGHDTGIYRFDFLRRLCPCAECRGDPGAKPPVER